MSPLFGNILVGGIVALISALAARSLWKDHKSGKHCDGDCSHCGGCHK